MKIKFDARGNKAQLECIEAWNNNSVKEICFSGGKGCGKKWAGINLIFKKALLNKNTNYYIARDRMIDLIMHMHPTICYVLKDLEVDNKDYEFDNKNNVWTLKNGSKIQYLEIKYIPSDPFYFRFNNLLFDNGFVVEASSIGYRKVKTVLGLDYEYNEKIEKRLLLALRKITIDKILFTCHPSKNFLYRDFYLKKDNLPKHRKFIQATIRDNKILNNDYFKEIKNLPKTKEIDFLINGTWF